MSLEPRNSEHQVFISVLPRSSFALFTALRANLLLTVKLAELEEKHEIPEGRYKLFTCDNYRNIVFSRMKQDLIDLGMGTAKIEITLGLAAGNVYQSKSEEIRTLFTSRAWAFLSPEDIRDKVTDLAAKGYENEPSIITAKILMR